MYNLNTPMTAPAVPISYSKSVSATGSKDAPSADHRGDKSAGRNGLRDHLRHLAAHTEGSQFSQELASRALLLPAQSVVDGHA